MTDWQLIEGEEIIGTSTRELDQPHLRWGWFLLAGTIALLLVTIFLVVRGRRLERQAAIRADLTAVIFEEETVRSLGDPERVAEFILADAPEPWRQAYHQTFSPFGDQTAVNTVEIKTLDFDGQCAVVTVDLDGIEQIRAYCLRGQQWRRAPVPAEAWGHEPTVVDLGLGLRLRYLPRDRTFAKALTRDLRRYLKEFDRLLLNPAPAASDSPQFAVEIVIEPHDLYDPLIQVTPERIVLNSPWLVPLGGEQSGEAAVRHALAQVLLRPVEGTKLHRPLMAAFHHLETDATGHSRLFVELPGRSDPLAVELPPELAFDTFTGAVLPPGCTPPGTKLEIDGKWVTYQQHLQATQIRVQDVTPLNIEAAPPESVAFLLAGDRSSAEALVALTNDGKLHRLTTLNPTRQLFPLPIVAGDDVHFLFKLDLPECARSWFVRYEVSKGIIGQWLAPPPPMQWVWRPYRQDLFFFGPRDDGPGYYIYQHNPTLALEPMGQSGPLLLFLGWHTKRGQLVAADTVLDETYIGLFDWTSGYLKPTGRPFHQPLRFRRLSPDGNWLAYLAGIQNWFGPPVRLKLLDVTNNSEQTLIQAPVGEGLGPPTWSLYLDQPILAILSGSVVDDALHPSRLLVSSPDRPNDFTILAQAASDEKLAAPVFCANGDLLYRVEQKSQYRLQRHSPHLRARTLLVTNEPFWPLACP